MMTTVAGDAVVLAVVVDGVAVGCIVLMVVGWRRRRVLLLFCGAC